MESRVWRVDPGRGQLLAVKRQHEGIGVRSSTTGNVFRRSYRNTSDFSRRSYRTTSLGHYRSKVPLLSGMQGGVPPLQPPSLPASLMPPWALGGAPI